MSSIIPNNGYPNTHNGDYIYTLKSKVGYGGGSCGGPVTSPETAAGFPGYKYMNKMSGGKRRRRRSKTRKSRKQRKSRKTRKTRKTRKLRKSRRR